MKQNVSYALKKNSNLPQFKIIPHLEVEKATKKEEEEGTKRPSYGNCH